MKPDSQTKNSGILTYWKPFLYWVFAAAITVGISYLLLVQTTIAIIVFGASITTLLVRKNYIWGLCGILFLPVIGELLRLPFGGENGMLISDLAIAILGVIWGYEKIIARKTSPSTQKTFSSPLIVFCLLAALSLLFSLTFLSPVEVMSGSLYLIRFIEYSLLGVMTVSVIKTENDRKRLLNTMIISALVIAIAGFIQLNIYPDLGKIAEYGWDPHINRLVSTWLDPNFIAGFLSFILAIVGSITLHTKEIRKKMWLGGIIMLLVIAIFLTYSRSGYVAAGIVLFTIGILKSRKLLITSIILIIAGMGVLPRAQERVNNLIHSAQSLIFNTSENPDATARLRIISWQQTFELIEKRPLLGSGYNTLKYVKYNEGFVNDPSVHSASGSDSSFLTILATTGILGFIPYILIYWNVLKLSIKNWRNKKNAPLWQGYSLGIFAGTLGLIGHSFFVNSLLFPQILIFFWISIGLLKSIVEQQEELQGEKSLP